MNQFENSLGNVVKIFAKTFELEALMQVQRMSNFEPYLNSKIRVMPDAHAGKGCTVGTTMTIHNKVTPNLVGVDVGCGMLTIRIKEADVDLALLDAKINQHIPSGFNVHDHPKNTFDFSELKCLKHVDVNRASLSLGSLGGGNHFIELSKSEKDGSLYLVVHSGSRKLGGDVCKFYQEKAIAKANRNNVKIRALIDDLKSKGRHQEIEAQLKQLKPIHVDNDLSYVEEDDFDSYMHDMRIAQEFANMNRNTIADIIIGEMNFTEVERFQTIHNYIDFNRGILRKGAVSAEMGEKLLIPINMRDGSLLCIGKGNEDWNYSAPHGAGRLMSRGKAVKNISMDEFKQSMEGIFSSSIHESTLDEAPQAYKPMSEIIEAIQDTATVIDRLVPIYNFKAH